MVDNTLSCGVSTFYQISLKFNEGDYSELSEKITLIFGHGVSLGHLKLGTNILIILVSLD